MLKRQPDMVLLNKNPLPLKCKQMMFLHDAKGLVYCSFPNANRLERGGLADFTNNTASLSGLSSGLLHLK